MKKSKIQAYLLRVSDTGEVYKGYIAEVENSLQAEQEYVGGYIQVISIGKSIDVICNDEGKLDNLPPNRAWMIDGKAADILVGNIMCCRHDGLGNFTDILEEDIPIIEKILIPLILLPKEYKEEGL